MSCSYQQKCILYTTILITDITQFPWLSNVLTYPKSPNRRELGWLFSSFFGISVKLCLCNFSIFLFVWLWPWKRFGDFGFCICYADWIWHGFWVLNIQRRLFVWLSSRALRRNLPHSGLAIWQSVRFLVNKILISWNCITVCGNSAFAHLCEYKCEYKCEY